MSCSAGDVLFENKGFAGIITLNRPSVLNALSIDMINQIHSKLIQWRDDNSVYHVIIEGKGERAFCAGGDIRSIYNDVMDGHLDNFIDFYRCEYQLNYAIRTYPKPWIALIDGINMGGGVGVSIHGRYRIVTERLIFSMPETGIGLFPDVGGSWFLPRLPGKVGIWLGLTGSRLNASGALYTGLATHYVLSRDLPELKKKLIFSLDLESILDEVSLNQDMFFAPDEVMTYRDLIDKHFCFQKIEEIVSSLETKSHLADSDLWAQRQLDTLRKKSPTSLKITLKQIQKGLKISDFAECLKMEYRMIHGVLKGKDFFEGVRALIIDKDKNPIWQFDQFEGVSNSLVDSYFKSPPSGDLILNL